MKQNNNCYVIGMFNKVVASIWRYHAWIVHIFTTKLKRNIFYRGW